MDYKQFVEEYHYLEHQIKNYGDFGNEEKLDELVHQLDRLCMKYPEYADKLEGRN